MGARPHPPFIVHTGKESHLATAALTSVAIALVAVIATSSGAMLNTAML